MTDMYQARISYSGVDFTGYVNGFPLLDVKTAAENSSGGTSAPLNPVLVGKGNLLRIEITGRGENPQLSGGVDRLKPGDWADTDGEAHFELGAGDVIEYKFDSEYDNFSELLAKAQPADAAAITAFALKLRDTLNSGDSKAALELLKPKFEVLAQCFGAPLEMMLQQAGGFVESAVSYKHTFEAADVNPQPCCDGKLWRLLRHDGRHLITMEDDEGSMSFELTAAMLPDGPAIVR